MAALDDRDAKVWTSIIDCARRRGEATSARHACLACAESLPGSDVALTVAGEDVREIAWATGELGERLEELQFTVGEGPVVAALATGGPVLVADLSEPATLQRWPAFGHDVAATQARGAFAFPLQVGAVRLGVLAIYRRERGPLSPEQLGDALAYAEAALVLLLDAKAGIVPHGWKPSINGYGAYHMSHHRAEVHQATGMISAQLRIGTDEALLRLRAYAYTHGRPIGDLAHEVVARRLRFGIQEDGSGDS